MRTDISLMARICDVVRRYPQTELVYLKTDKDDRTDLTFMTTAMNEELCMYLKNRLHPYSMEFTVKEWPVAGGSSVRVEMFDVNC